MGRKTVIGAAKAGDRDKSVAVEVLNSNRTIVATALNSDEGEDTELRQCRSTKEVFEAFKPSKDVEIKTEDGTTEIELTFREVPDFSPDKVIAQSHELQAQKNERLILTDFLKAVKTNSALRKAMDSDKNPEEREKVMEALRAALAALGGEEG